ncbi:hypothetical protein [Limnofasciculus baicalensis]|uniref:Uncharacterized protein n=1 Tax=Limnofasciculus baicalensis BBK-W-15 TaxID=2699891 RepID=A0AAE3GS90_9CYAN|nr:hypothetical protein [Limnofasciculus baicalensis]MCP2729006.1 hypothetical protein [Limnofasciculus baicalensis BBK-W-15]
MKLISIALATICALPLSLSLSLASLSEQPCQASLDTSNGIDSEVNNCPTTRGSFSIAGTFSNSNWQASFWAWEPAYYILHVKNKQDGSKINLTGFDVTGTTNRPQYRFTDENRNLTYIVTFRYSDPETIRLEIKQNGKVIVNQLLPRESDQRIGGP